MIVTLLGIVIVVNPLQLINVLFSMQDKLLGIVMLVILSHPKKAYSPIFVILFVKFILFKLSHPRKALSPMLTKVSGNTIFDIFLHPEKAHLSILDTLLGMVMFVRFEQPENADTPMLVIPLFIITFFTEEALDFHGTSFDDNQDMSPIPEITSVPPLSSSHVKSSPKVPLAVVAAAITIVVERIKAITTLKLKINCKNLFFNYTTSKIKMRSPYFRATHEKRTNSDDKVATLLYNLHLFREVCQRVRFYQ